MDFPTRMRRYRPLSNRVTYTKNRRRLITMPTDSHLVAECNEQNTRELPFEHDNRAAMFILVQRDTAASLT